LDAKTERITAFSFCRLDGHQRARLLLLAPNPIQSCLKSMVADPMGLGILYPAFVPAFAPPRRLEAQYDSDGPRRPACESDLEAKSGSMPAAIIVQSPLRTPEFTRHPRHFPVLL
jgi:hypothetical protein